MHINSFIKNYILYLPFGFTSQIPEIVVVEEEKFKFHTLVFQKLEVVIPVCVLFISESDLRTVTFKTTVANHQKPISHEYFTVFFLQN